MDSTNMVSHLTFYDLVILFCLHRVHAQSKVVLVVKCLSLGWC